MIEVMGSIAYCINNNFTNDPIETDIDQLIGQLQNLKANLNDRNKAYELLNPAVNHYKSSSNIYDRIRETVNEIESNAKKDKLYGYSLMSNIMKVVDDNFEGLTSWQEDIITMRVMDSLERKNVRFHV